MRGLREHISRIHVMYGDFIVMGDPLLVWNTAGPQSSSLTRLRNEARVVSLLIDIGDEQNSDGLPRTWMKYLPSGRLSTTSS